MSSLTKKRKAVTTSGGASKKSRSSASTVAAIISEGDEYDFPTTDDAFRKLCIDLAEYARGLEQQIDANKPKALSPDQVAAAAVKLRNAARSGIRKQLVWKPSAKMGTAKWSYDGVCADPLVFGALLNLKGAPNFKIKKLTVDEFEDLIGDLAVAIRYDTLTIKNNVNIQWKADEGTFKFSGTYGK